MKMGYRSDVAIAAYGDKEKLVELKTHYDNAVANLSSDSLEDLNYLVASSEENLARPIWDDETGDFMFYVTHVKWYDGYPCVDLFNTLFGKAIAIELAAERVRIGEEIEDNEEEFIDGDEGCEYRFNVSRSISF
jgi:hypothetical protein